MAEAIGGRFSEIAAKRIRMQNAAYHLGLLSGTIDHKGTPDASGMGMEPHQETWFDMGFREGARETRRTMCKS